MFIAGIDGGGTHTRLERRDMENRLLQRLEFGPFNINAIGAEAFRSLLREVFAACGGMEQCAGLCVGAAGISNPRMLQILRQELDAAGFHGESMFCGDQQIALRGAMDGPGIALIAGTGSICFGQNGAGETARSGGYGHLIDDEGSGYTLGRDVFRAAVRALDGRTKDSAMLRAVCEQLGGGGETIVPFVYGPETDKAAIARFSWIALELAGQGNPEAVDILRRGAEGLAQLVAAVQEKLGLEGCRIALLGGLIASDTPYRRVVADRLGTLGTVISPQRDALWGAAQLAWELTES